jgi:hypothetical protein
MGILPTLDNNPKTSVVLKGALKGSVSAVPYEPQN